jgi:alginate O-acetyltransferase complex protein AlgI
VVWGAYHGVLLGIYRRWPWIWDRQSQWAQRVFTFLLVVFGWVFFRSATWNDALVLLNLMLVPQTGSMVTGWPLLLVMLVIAGVCAHFGPNTFEMSHRWTPVYAAGLTGLFVLCLIAMYGGQISPFLYFQF